jgi:hypothetical protein
MSNGGGIACLSSRPTRRRGIECAERALAEALTGGGGWEEGSTMEAGGLMRRCMCGELAQRQRRFGDGRDSFSQAVCTQCSRFGAVELSLLLADDAEFA